MLMAEQVLQGARQGLQEEVIRSGYVVLTPQVALHVPPAKNRPSLQDAQVLAAPTQVLQVAWQAVQKLLLAMYPGEQAVRQKLFYSR
jgi:hypothetical protein